MRFNMHWSNFWLLITNYYTQCNFVFRLHVCILASTLQKGNTLQTLHIITMYFVIFVSWKKLHIELLMEQLVNNENYTRNMNRYSYNWTSFSIDQITLYYLFLQFFFYLFVKRMKRNIKKITLKRQKWIKKWKLWGWWTFYFCTKNYENSHQLSVYLSIKNTKLTRVSIFYKYNTTLHAW